MARRCNKSKLSFLFIYGIFSILMSAIDFTLLLLMMNTLHNNTPNNAADNLQESLRGLTQTTNQLADALQRSPAEVNWATIKLANRFLYAQDFLVTDTVLNLFNQMKKHLTNIHNAIQAGELYDNETITTHAQTENLVTLLFEQKDVLAERRNQDNYLNETYGFVINEINDQIQTIIDNTPVLLSRAA